MKTTTESKAHHFMARDFSAKVRRALLKRGIVIIGSQNLPGDGDMPYANGIRGYQLSDNGTFRIRTYFEVEALAAG